MIICFRCKQEKEDSEFLDKKGNIVERCFNCRGKTNKWKDENPERVKLYNKFYKANKISEKTYVYAKKKNEEIWIKFDSQSEAAIKLILIDA